MDSNSTIIKNILEKIDFKISPDKNIRNLYTYRIKKKFYKIFNKEKNFINSITKFKNIDNLDAQSLEILKNFETMSRISIGFLINQIAKNLTKDQLYLNIGVWRGFSMFSAMLNTSCFVHGVDDFSHDTVLRPNLKESNYTKNYFHQNFNKIKVSSRHFFHDIDYLVFFKNFEKENKGIDFYYYDGDHSFKAQYNNLCIAHNFLKKNSLILIDDYNETEVQEATQDFIRKNNKNYKILEIIKTANRFIHPTFANGLILLEKIN